LGPAKAHWAFERAGVVAIPSPSHSLAHCATGTMPCFGFFAAIVWKSQKSAAKRAKPCTSLAQGSR